MVARRALYFLAASVLFGGTFVAAKAGLAHFPPLLFVALRFDIAALVLLAYVAVSAPAGERLPRTRADFEGVLATGLVTVGLTNALIFVGQQHVTSGVASIIASLNPVLTPVFAAVLLSEKRLGRRGTVGMALGLVGVALVANPAPSELLAGGMRGEALLLGAAVAGALGSVLVRRADTGVSSTVRTAWGLPFGAALAHALSLAAGESAASVTLTADALIALGYVSVGAGALAYIAYFGLMDEVGATRANLVFYVVPVVATLGGAALLGERISWIAIAGFLVVFAGFALLAGERDTRDAGDERRRGSGTRDVGRERGRRSVAGDIEVERGRRSAARDVESERADGNESDTSGNPVPIDALRPDEIGVGLSGSDCD